MSRPDPSSKIPDASFASSVEERRSFVEGQYDHLWRGVAEKLDKILESGERDLSRVHLFMRRNFGPDFEDAHLREKYADHDRQIQKTGFIMDRQLVKVVDMDPRVATLLTDALKMREAISCFGPGVERIVELGSGWGKNLFNLFKFGSSLEAEYWGLELTAAGRQLMERVGAETVPSMKVRSAPFDYYNADFGVLAQERPTCVFTHHSLEQIPEAPRELFERILTIPGFRSCLHLEPCGFQVPGNKWLDGASPGVMESIDQDNRRFAGKRNQNANLYPLLREMEKAGRIRILSVKKYFTSHLINNATTSILWAPADAPVPTGAGWRRDDL
jgi:hypothetical protein